MKRLLIYIMVAIVLVVCGISIYYVVRDDETITSLVADTDSFYLNIGETVDIPIARDNPASYAEFSVVEDGLWEDYLDIDMKNWKMTALKAGPMSVKFKSSNEKYKSQEFVIDCKIGDGSAEAPYYLRTEEDLNKIGKFGWHYSDHYELANDIVMTEPFMPIGIYGEDGTIRYYDDGNKIVIDEFTGTLTGGVLRHKIVNMKIRQGNLNYSTAGFIAMIGKGGVVEDVVFENASIEGEFSYVGTIAGVCYGTIGKCTIENSSIVNNKTVILPEGTEYTGDGAYTGGICGMLDRIDSRVAQINICSADVSIVSRYVAGGAVGRNDGGVIFNCMIRTNNLDFTPPVDVYGFSGFGGIAGMSQCEYFGDSQLGYDAIYDPFVSNCIVYIDNITSSKLENVCEIFGAYSALNGTYKQESRGTYENLYYVYGNRTDLKKYAASYFEEDISDSVKEITTSEAMNPSTYEGRNWDFENVWDIAEGEHIELGFDKENSVEYQTYSTRTATSAITQENLAQTIERMRSNPTSDRTYTISEDLVYDGNVYGAEWEPIGTEENPFIGKIKSLNGATLTFKNLRINSDFSRKYAGIFGIIYGTNTEIEGIVIAEDSNFFEINGQVVGAIAGYNSMAHISNCKVSNFNVTTRQIAGGIVGINDSGKIENCLINAEEYLTDQPVYDEDGNETGDIEALPTTNGRGKSVYSASLTYTQIGFDDVTTIDKTLGGFALGGLAGINNGTIADCTSGGVQIKVGDEISRGNVYLGGAIGYGKGKAQDITVDGFSINATELKGSSYAYAGGIIGWQDGGKIEYALVASFTGNTIQFNIENDKTTAGGLVGIMAKDSIIDYSVSDSMTIDAAVAGGFAGVASGKIRQSYISGTTTLNAWYAGGFAVSLFDGGLIENCMTAANINGSKLSAGMALYLFKGSKVNYSYIDPKFAVNPNTFGTESNIYAETASQFRRSPNDYGSVTNTAIVCDEEGYKPLISGVGDKTIMPNDDIKINGVTAKLQTAFFTFGVEVNAVGANEVSTSKEALEKLGFDFKQTWSNETGGYFLPLEASKLINSSVMNSAATQSAYIYVKNIESIEISVNGTALDQEKYISNIYGGYIAKIVLGGQMEIKLNLKEGFEVTDFDAVSGTVEYDQAKGTYRYSDFVVDATILTFKVEQVYELKINAPHTQSIKVQYGHVVKTITEKEGDTFIVKVPKGQVVKISLTLEENFAVSDATTSSGLLTRIENETEIEYSLIDYLANEEDTAFELTFTVAEKEQEPVAA